MEPRFYAFHGSNDKSFDQQELRRQEAEKVREHGKIRD
jgi:hypothetical protein